MSSSPSRSGASSQQTGKTGISGLSTASDRARWIADEEARYRADLRTATKEHNDLISKATNPELIKHFIESLKTVQQEMKASNARVRKIVEDLVEGTRREAERRNPSSIPRETLTEKVDRMSST